jgi:recombinational DNA repair ATPase RecF
LDADFAPGFHLLLGDNAQGKTNILEATANRYLPLPARLCYI